MIFIDTGAFLARHIKEDQYHAKSLKYWDRLRDSQESCLTSNFVLDETFTLLARRAGYLFAAERAQHLYASKSLAILRPNHEDEIQAIALFQKYADQKVSFTDCISIVLMKEKNIKKVFSFDQHFERAGFEIFPC